MYGIRTKAICRRVLKVLSYNIHKGFNASSAKFVLRSIRQAIRTVHADLVFLQEVIGEHAEHASRIEDWPQESQFEFMADEVWQHHAYGRNAIYSDGHHGNAILSKFPIKRFENIDVSTNRLERRGLLHGVIDWMGADAQGGIELHVICLHFDLSERGRRKQIQSLREHIDRNVPADAPLIVAGDFNDWREKATQELGRTLGLNEAFHSSVGEHPRTFPIWLPLLKLDRIYFRGLKVERADCLTGAPWNELSDHAAIYAEFRRAL